MNEAESSLEHEGDTAEASSGPSTQTDMINQSNCQPHSEESCTSTPNSVATASPTQSLNCIIDIPSATAEHSPTPSGQNNDQVTHEICDPLPISPEPLNHEPPQQSTVCCNDQDTKVDAMHSTITSLKSSPDEAPPGTPQPLKEEDNAIQIREQQLENNILYLQRMLAESNDKLQQKDADMKKVVTNLQAEMRMRLEHCTRTAEEAKREKESMVLKFAQAEQRHIEAQKKVRDMENKLKECQKERDSILARARNLKTEKEKLQSQHDARCTDFATFEKEMQTLRESVASSEQKLKWHQTRLSEEQERSRQLRTQHDECAKRLVEVQEEVDSLQQLCQTVISQNSDALSKEAVTQSKDFISQIKFTLEEVKRLRLVAGEQEQLISKLNKEMESLKKHLKDSIQEGRTLKEKYTLQEADRLCKEEVLNSTKQSLKQVKTAHEQALERLKQLEPLEKEVVHLRLHKEKSLHDYELLCEAKRDLEQEMDGLRRKESELLEFTQRLSDRNASLQAENLNLRSRCENLLNEQNTMSSKMERMENDLQGMRHSLEEERRAWMTSRHELETQLAEKVSAETQLQQALNDERNGNRALAKKHAAQRKDLTHQVDQLQRRLQELSSGVGSNATPEHCIDGTNHGYRNSIADSISLHSTEESPRNSSSGVPYHHKTLEENSPAAANCDPYDDARFTVKMVEPDKQALIEKIVLLQKANARLTEKVDFFREHTSQLTKELRTKHKLLQTYLLREESGAISPERFDLHHHMMAQKGGIMASLYNSHSSDDYMSLDLSLEINKKLQAVLEDALLKNIMLKENISTLGEEIGRLNKEKQQMQTLLSQTNHIDTALQSNSS